MSRMEMADQAWNPSTGCTKVSPGCRNCWAKDMSNDMARRGVSKYRFGFAYVEHADAIGLPAKWKKPRMISVCTMGDFFHPRATDGFMFDCLDAMRRAGQHTYQILTKRPDRMRDVVGRYCRGRSLGSLPRNIWLGVSVENPGYLWRIDSLRQAMCRTRFVAFEPLLEPIRDPDLSGIDRVTVGGESGDPRYIEKMEPQWVALIINACRRHGTAFHFEQWGGPRNGSGGRLFGGSTYDEYPTYMDGGQQTLDGQ